MYSALGDKAGSAVALDMQGKVLGLVSSPSYDPNDLSNYLKELSLEPTLQVVCTSS